MALERPLNDPKGELIAILKYIDIATTVIFCLECIMKIIAFGLIFNGKHSYLRNVWNIVDFLIIIFSIISLTPLSDSFKTFKMLRVIRCLRLLNKNEGL